MIYAEEKMGSAVKMLSLAISFLHDPCLQDTLQSKRLIEYCSSPGDDPDGTGEKPKHRAVTVPSFGAEGNGENPAPEAGGRFPDGTALIPAEAPQAGRGGPPRERGGNGGRPQGTRRCRATAGGRGTDGLTRRRGRGRRLRQRPAQLPLSPGGGRKRRSSRRSP